MLCLIISSFSYQTDTVHMTSVAFQCALPALFAVTLQLSIMWYELFKWDD